MSSTKRCAIIIRVSDIKQAKRDRSSLDNQLTELRGYIQAKNLVKNGTSYVEHAIYEMEGVSGKHSIVSQRFLDLKSDVILKKIDAVLCTDLDRLGRNVAEFVEFFQLLRDNNVDLISTRLGLDTSSAMGQAIAVILMTLAQLENSIKSEKVLRARYIRSENGLFNGMRPILGYDLNPDPKKAGELVVNDTEGEIVRLAFSLYLQLGSDDKVAQRLTERGYRNKAWLQRESNEKMGGGPITANVVRTMLTNIIYRGMLRRVTTDDKTGEKVEELLEGCWEPLVDAQLFEQVQQARERASRERRNTTRTTKHFYLIGDIIHCGECDSKMRQRAGTGKNKQVYHDYFCENDRCPVYLQTGRRHHINAQKADGVVYDALLKIAMQEDSIKQICRVANETIIEALPSLRAERKQMQDALDGFVRQIESKAIALESLSAASPARAPLSEQISTIEDSIARAKQRLDDLDREIGSLTEARLSREEVRRRLNNLGVIASHGSDSQRRDVIRMVINKVVLEKSRIAVEMRICSLVYLSDMSTRSGVFIPIEDWLPGEDLNLEPSG